MHVKFVTSNVIGKLEKWDDIIILYKIEVEIMQSRYEATLLAYMHVYSYIYGCGKMNILSMHLYPEWEHWYGTCIYEREERNVIFCVIADRCSLSEVHA